MRHVPLGGLGRIRFGTTSRIDRAGKGVAWEVAMARLGVRGDWSVGQTGLGLDSRMGRVGSKGHGPACRVGAAKYGPVRLVEAGWSVDLNGSSAIRRQESDRADMEGCVSSEMSGPIRCVTVLVSVSRGAELPSTEQDYDQLDFEVGQKFRLLRQSHGYRTEVRAGNPKAPRRV